MIQVNPGANLPLTVIIGNRETGLVVKAVLQTMSGEVLDTITLTEVNDCVFTDYSFPMPFGENFIVAKYEVYDSDGTTPNENNGNAEDLFGVIVPIYAQTLKVTLDCEEHSNPNPPVIVQTSDEDFALNFVDQDGNGFNTSTASSITVKFRKIDGTALVKDLDDGITPVNVYTGKYLLSMTDEDFADLPTGGTGVNLQAEVVFSGDTKVVQLRPAFILQESIV